MAHHVFITGGGTGIGLATARALASTGARFTLVGRDGARAQDAAEQFENAQGLSCDVADEASVAAAFTAARDRYGPIDILINNAGITPSAPVDRMDLSLWNQTLAINLTGAFLCSRAAITDMYANKWGRIVNVASIAGLQGAAYISAYCASKHGMI
ncbi:MAG: SDR family NAD(P)-dependent oxidoreductase, partial [Terricaulis sp.]